MKEMIEKLKKMSLIKKIITIYTVVVIFPVFMLVSYLSMVQYEKLYTETVQQAAGSGAIDAEHSEFTGDGRNAVSEFGLPKSHFISDFQK